MEDLDPRILEAMKPGFAGYYMQKCVSPVISGYSNKPYVGVTISDNIGALRGSITSSVKYRDDKTNMYWLNYEWDVDNEAWSLLDFVPPDTHKDDFPWRKRKK